MTQSLNHPITQSLNHPINPPASDFAIETHVLRKVFGSKVAVSGLTLEVPRGEVFGFLGPNGAGKSTSVKMLLGLVARTSGEARLLGKRAGDVATRRKIGFLPEHFRFYDWLTSTELLEVHGRLYGMDRARLRRRIPELLDLVGLTPHRTKRLKEYSKGMLQRIGLAQAILNQPELIFLDEPTSGLDPMGRRLVRDVIRAERDRGATVFLNSHLLSEVEVTCDRVAFIKHGEVVSTRNLKDQVEDVTTVEIRVRRVNSDALAGLKQWASSIHIDGERIKLSVANAGAVPEIVRHLVARGADIYEISPQRLSLEDLFLAIVGEDGGL